MSDPSARQLANWLLGKHRLASLGVFLACLMPALLLEATVEVSSWWMVITVGATVVAGGFVQLRSWGLVRWSERLPANSGSVWGAQLIWILVLALPATLAAGLLLSDPESALWRAARSTAWLVCLGAALLAPFRFGTRLPFVVGLAAWLVSAELCLTSGAVSMAGAVLHDLILTAVTLTYVLAFVRRRQDDPISAGFLIFGILLLVFGPLPAVSWVGLAVFGWVALSRNGLVPRLVKDTGLSFTSTLLIVIAGWPVWVFLYRLLTDWSGSMTAARLEVGYAVGPGPLITPGRLVGTAVCSWVVILIAGEMRRLEAYERWKRRRTFLERMPLTRKQFLALAFGPQLKIIRQHFMMGLIVGLATSGVFFALGLKGVVEVWLFGLLICSGSLIYLFISLLPILRRGLGYVFWIMAFSLPVTLLWSMYHEVFGLFTVAMTILILACVALLRVGTSNPDRDARERARAEYERVRAQFEKAEAARDLS